MKKIFAANWKLYKNPSEARAFFAAWGAAASVLDVTNADIFFFPTALSLEATSQSLQKSSFYFGSQNCFFETEGAYTGEISASHVQSIGAAAILIGHSERRSLFNENDQMISKKVQLVQKQGMIPFLCIGETLPQREAGLTLKVLSEQLKQDLEHADTSKKLVVAYEPVWAIGTGKVAEPAQIAEAHLFVKQQLKELGFENVAVLYGGSVKPEKASELIQIPNVDGFLVGGASLEVPSFLKICQA